MNMKEAEALGIDLETVDPVKQKQGCEIAADDRTIIDEIYTKVSCI